MINKFVLTLFTLLLFFPKTNSQTIIAKYAGEFLAIGVGGRSLGMGDAYVAVANDVTAGYFNPAGLAQLNYPEFALMHEERFGNLVNYDYAAVAVPYGKDMTFGLSIIRLGVDGIPDTRGTLIDENTGQVSTVPGFNINSPSAGLNYSNITEFSDQDWAVFLSFAKKYSDNFYYGANVKLIYEGIAEYNAYGLGFDVGAWYTPFQNFSLGLNLQDITTTLVAWSTGTNELITPTAKMGAAYKFNFLGGQITPALDFDVRFEDRSYAAEFNLGPVSFDMNAGFEYSFKNLVMIRAGYNEVKQLTLGAGIRLPRLNIDYSFAKFNESDIESLPDTHRISIMVSLDEPKFLRSGF
jgi:hypothetical protein